jgi:hypothetical protein
MDKTFKDINAELSKRRKSKKSKSSSKSKPIKQTIMTYQKRPDKLSETEIIIIDDFASRVDIKRDIVLDDLKYIGVSEEGIIILKCCYLQFLSREQNRTMVLQLKRSSLKDYELISYFFYSLKQSTALSSIPLDYKTRELQEQSIRYKYKIGDNDKIPDAVNTIIFTKCCKEKKTFDAQNNGIRYYGHEKIVYDRNKQKYLCCGKKSKNNSKSKTGRTNRKQDRNRYNKKCKETEIIPLPIIGNIVQFNSPKEKPNPKSYTICPNYKCGTVTEFSISMFGPNGFTCGVCDLSERLKYRYPECSGKCGKIGEKMGKWSSVYMLDDCDTEDGPGTYRMKKYHFCAECSRKCIIDKMNRSRVLNTKNNHHTQAISYKESLALLYSPVKTHDEFERVLWSCSNNVKKYVKTIQPQ